MLCGPIIYRQDNIREGQKERKIACANQLDLLGNTLRLSQQGLWQQVDESGVFDVLFIPKGLDEPKSDQIRLKLVTQIKEQRQQDGKHRLNDQRGNDVDWLCARASHRANIKREQLHPTARSFNIKEKSKFSVTSRHRLKIAVIEKKLTLGMASRRYMASGR